MALQFNIETLIDAMLDQIESQTGTDARLRVYTGSAPANCAAAATGTLLVTIVCPTDWMNAASAGSKTKLGTWSATASGGAADTPGYFRIWDSSVTTCYVQGTAGIGSGDLQFDGTITSGQTVTVNTFTITGGGA